jgi:hypothetical protein
VGYQDFVTKGKYCSIFYPADTKGIDKCQFGVPLCTYGAKQIDGIMQIVARWVGPWVCVVARYMLKPMLKVQIPVYVRAKGIVRDETKVVLFSHGNTGNRLIYSCLLRELASCGYVVISITHSDNSADFHPTKGLFGIKDYKLRNYKMHTDRVKIRIQNIRDLINDTLEPGFFN